MMSRWITTWLCVALSTVSIAAALRPAVAQTVLFDFEDDLGDPDDQGWGRYGVVTTDRGTTPDGSVGWGSYHVGDFTDETLLPPPPDGCGAPGAPVPCGWGMVDVSPLFGTDLSGFVGLSVDARFINAPDPAPAYTGHMNLDVGLGFFDPDTFSEVEEAETYKTVTVTDAYQTINVFFSELDLSHPKADLANSIIKLRWLNDDTNKGFGELDYDQITGLLTAPGVDGDYNDNNVVDAADYTVWRNHLNTSATLPHDPTPGVVDASDYTLWKTDFGLTASTGAGSANTLTVPEPQAIALATVGLALIILVGVRRSAQGQRHTVASTPCR